MSNYNSILVTVIMANYNTPIKYLKESIDSVLNQSHSNFELIIVDDCSTDDSFECIKNFSDERIVVLRNDENKGPAYTRNRGLEIAQGKYIAVMDSDDISEPNRFEKQVEYMEAHPEVIVCASWAKVFGEEMRNSYLFDPSLPDQETFRISLLFGDNYIANPTVMINHRILKQSRIRYIDEYIAAQDYRMWIDCVQWGEFAMICEPLVKRRMQNKSITKSKGEVQQRFRWKIIQAQLDKLHYTLSEDNKKYYNCIYSPRKLYDLRTKEIVKELISANHLYKVYNQQVFKKYLWEKWAVISIFGLKNEKGVKKKFQVLINMPISRYHYMIKTVLALFSEKRHDNRIRE